MRTNRPVNVFALLLALLPAGSAAAAGPDAPPLDDALFQEEVRVLAPPRTIPAAARAPNSGGRPSLVHRSDPGQGAAGDVARKPLMIRNHYCEIPTQSPQRIEPALRLPESRIATKMIRGQQEFKVWEEPRAEPCEPSRASMRIAFDIAQQKPTQRGLEQESAVAPTAVVAENAPSAPRIVLDIEPRTLPEPPAAAQPIRLQLEIGPCANPSSAVHPVAFEAAAAAPSGPPARIRLEVGKAKDLAKDRAVAGPTLAGRKRLD